MAKKEFKKEALAEELKAPKLVLAKKDSKKEMSLEEAKAYRASLYRPQSRILSETEKQQQFKLFWAQNRKKYGQPKELEKVLWMHLKKTGNDQIEKFDAGIQHFGFKKVR
jgi:hypothetical protein